MSRILVLAVFLGFIGQPARSLPTDLKPAIELLYLKLADSSEIFVLPRRTEETVPQALESYRSALAGNTSLAKFSASLEKTLISGSVDNLSTSDAVLIVANDPPDLSTKASRIHGIFKALAKGALGRNRAYAVLPVGASLRLSPAERHEFHFLLKRRFQMLMALGGDDVHPSFYREPITYSHKPNYTRDFLEISLIRDFHRPLGPLDKNGNFLFGICRGAQIIKVALEGKVLGESITQDIVKEGLTETPHNLGTEQPIRLLSPSDSLLNEALKGQSLNMYMYHHQAIRNQADSMFELAAVGVDGVPEAFVSKDHRIMLTQFHPELMPTIAGPGAKIFEAVENRAFEKSLVCESLF